MPRSPSQKRWQRKGCKNRPVCRNPVTRVGYCDSCKALRILLSEIHGEADHRHAGGPPTEAELKAGRVAMHRARANGVVDSNEPRARLP